MGRVKLLHFTILSGKEQGPKLKALVYEFESALPSKNIANGNQVKSYRIYFFIYFLEIASSKLVLIIHTQLGVPPFFKVPTPLPNMVPFLESLFPYPIFHSTSS